jgi:hypothetical protein
MERQLRLVQTFRDVFPRLAPDSAGSGVCVAETTHFLPSSSARQVRATLAPHSTRRVADQPCTQRTIVSCEWSARHALVDRHWGWPWGLVSGPCAQFYSLQKGMNWASTECTALTAERRTRHGS